MTIEIEHKRGVSKEEVAAAEKDARRHELAARLGVSYDKCDSLIEEAKQFFTIGFKTKKLRFEHNNDN